MRKLTLMTLLSLTIIASIAGSALARTGLVSTPSSVTETGAFQIEGGLGNPTRCSITLNITMHASVAKTAGALVGLSRITVSTTRCSSGDGGLIVGGIHVTGAQGPYHMQYSSFAGTLPSITSVSLNVVGVSFWIRTPEGVECEARNVTIHKSTTGGNPATGYSIEAQNVPLGGGFLCSFSSGTISGFGTLASRLTITLI
jgi:hypothetical protein